MVLHEVAPSVALIQREATAEARKSDQFQELQEKRQVEGIDFIHLPSYVLFCALRSGLSSQEIAYTYFCKNIARTSRIDF